MPIHSAFEEAQLLKTRRPARPVFDLGTNDLLDRQCRIESNARSYPRRIPIALSAAEGIYVTDTEGHRYIDCLAGAGALALGHRHPVVVEAIQHALCIGLPWQTLDLTTPAKDQFAQDVLQSLPTDFSNQAKIQFCVHQGRTLWKPLSSWLRPPPKEERYFAFKGLTMA